MARIGTRQEEIGEAIGVSHVTLRKHFRKELDSAEVRANTTVATKLFDLCEAGNVTAIIFWLKCRAGWKDQAAAHANDAKPPDFVVELTGTGSADSAAKPSLQ